MPADRSPEEILEIRRKLVELEFYAKSDAAFLERLQNSPREVLIENGLDDITTEEVLPQLTGVSNASSDCGDYCDSITCWLTGCCFFTHDPPIVLPESIES